MGNEGLTFRPRSRTNIIILHDSHTPEDISSVTAWLRLEGRRKGLLEVGYHYVVERDGRIVQTRAGDTIGSHCPGHNHDSIGVCLAGGHEAGYMANQMRALEALLMEMRRVWYPSAELLAHHEVRKPRVKSGGRAHRCPAHINMDALRESTGFPVRPEKEK